YNARKKEEAKGLLKKFKENLFKAKLERNYYNKNTKLAEQQKKLVNEHFITKVSKIYYLSLRKVHLFGIQDKAVCEQINYVLDEDEIIGKGPNGTLSMVFDGIKRLNKGEKHLKITCDNAEILKGFIKHSNDLAGDYAKSWSKISSLNAKNYKQKNEYEEKIKNLEEELDNNKTTLLDFVRRLAEEKVKNMNLVKHSKEDKQALKNLNERLAKEKQNGLRIYLDKPLPKLLSKLKIFRRKVKTKFQHLIEKVKIEKQKLKQKLIAKIEMKIVVCHCVKRKENTEEKALPLLLHQNRGMVLFYERQINFLQEQLNETEEALEIKKRRNKIKELETENDIYKKEIQRLKTQLEQLTSQQVAQIEAKKNKR
ncbi:10958_t:CDS:2, partial [Gigaspora rosea]